MASATYQGPLTIMVTHAFLSAAWNAAGVWLIARGQPPLGPTASMSGVAVLGILILAYLITVKQSYTKSFLVLASIGALAGLLAIYGAFTKDHSLWPSELWRFTGIAVNSLALIGYTLTLRIYFQSNNHNID